jgi:hypothetical protein
MNNLYPITRGSSSPTASSAEELPAEVRIEAGTSCCRGIAMAHDKGTKSVVEQGVGDPMALMAKEMNRLSLQEREQAYEDLHGVSAMVNETPELIAAALQLMEHHLRSIRHKPAYNLAEANREEYVEDAKLRLMFLRAERFDVEKAANRLVQWLKWKLDLFGEELLCRKHIGLDQLDADARFMVDTGIMQFLPVRDSCGRVVQVVACNNKRHWGRSSKALLQMFFYMSMVAAEDEANQKNGLVHIVYGLGKNTLPTASSTPNHGELDEKYEVLGYSSITTCLPLRWDAVHFLTTSRAVQHAPALYVNTIGWHIRARLRVHVGSHLECQHGLLSFGVPSRLLPFTAEGELKKNNHKKWIQRRIVKDQAVLYRQPYDALYVFPGIDLPGRNDVLLGKGQPLQDHAGNRRLHELVETFFDEYNSAAKDGGRADVARKILHELKNSCTFGGVGSGNNRNGCRFLHLSEVCGWWEEVTDEDAMIKTICNRIRNLRLQKKLR